MNFKGIIFTDDKIYFVWFSVSGWLDLYMHTLASKMTGKNKTASDGEH